MTAEITRRGFVAAVGTALMAAEAPPAPYGAVPSARQVAWHPKEVCGFLHFTVNTFTDREWGYGDESPAIFNPAEFDADAIVSALSAGGMKGVILTCKHHDGFCLWPTKTTDHSIRSSPWRGGKGDVVREISEAARRHGLSFGVYLSPWDRNNANYGRPEYLGVYREQLRELLTSYGPVFEVWFDGANGGDGYYGGAREKRIIDFRTYYDWPGTWEIVRSLQPEAAIFSDAGPDIRWVGNEKGIAGDPCWATFNAIAKDGGPGIPGDARSQAAGNGDRHGARWLPAECDVSIRPGWFWHEKENGRVKTPAELMELYFQSVARGAHLLLNVPPDRRGLLYEADVASLREFGQSLAKLFGYDLARGAKVQAAQERGRAFRARNMVDGRTDTYWATPDSVTTPEAVLDLGSGTRFQVVRLREYLPLGQRVDAFALDAWQGGGWKQVAAATSVGPCRIVRLPEAVASNRIRLRITSAQACPAIQEVAVFQG